MPGREAGVDEPAFELLRRERRRGRPSDTPQELLDRNPGRGPSCEPKRVERETAKTLARLRDLIEQRAELVAMGSYLGALSGTRTDADVDRLFKRGLRRQVPMSDGVAVPALIDGIQGWALPNVVESVGVVEAVVRT